MSANKSFLLKYKYKCYCSKCMNEIIINTNNPKEIAIRQHEKECKTSFINNQTARDINDVYAYSVLEEDNNIILEIYRGENINNSFELKKIYSAKFIQNSKEIIEEGEENIDYWISIMEENFFYEDIYDLNDLNLNDLNLNIVINKVFYNVGYVDNITDFIMVYKSKGIKMPEKLYTKELAKIPVLKLDLNIGNKYNKKNVKICFYKEHVIDNKPFIEAIYVNGICKNGKLEVLNKSRILVSDNYVYNPKNSDIGCFYEENLIHKFYKFNKFYNLCPELRLKEYIESGGSRIIPFLLSQNNNLTLELLGKAGLGYIADNYYYIKDADFSATNVKKMFGIPIKALKCINSEYFESYIFQKRSLEAFRKIYNIQRMVFTETFTKETFDFIKDNINNNPRIIDFNENDILKYIEYTQKILPNIKTNENISTTAYYADYLNMCHSYNLYPGGKYPSNLKHFHDLMVVYRKERYEADKAEAFANALSNPQYYRLATIERKDSDYVILLPRYAQDLVQESYNMNNCVKGYVDRVARGNTYILFLRNKNKKSTSLVTIEVSPQYELIQAKASYNRKPSEKVIEYIKKWCRNKEINYSKCHDVL